MLLHVRPLLLLIVGLPSGKQMSTDNLRRRLELGLSLSREFRPQFRGPDFDACFPELSCCIGIRSAKMLNREKKSLRLRPPDDFERGESTETHCCEKLPIDHAVRGHIVVALVSANCTPRLRPHDPIDGSMIVASASKSPLYLHNCVSIVIPVIVVTVSVRVVSIIRIRIEEWKTKRVEEDERSIIETAEAIVSIIVAIVPRVTCAHHGPWRKARCRSRHRGSGHHL